MDREEAVQLLQRGGQGIGEWNRRRKDGREIPNLKKTSLRGFDLRGVDFRGANLRRIDFRSACLNHADLSGAVIESADLRKATLVSSDLHGCELKNAGLCNADLRNADLRGAVLDGACLIQANLMGANLNGARMNGAVCQATNFGNVNLSAVVGLQRVIHLGPSELSTSTLKRSLGSIPINFIKGCGLSDWQVLNAKLFDPMLTDEGISDIQKDVQMFRSRQGIQTRPLFISFAAPDSEFAHAVGAALDGEGIRFWLDRHDGKTRRVEESIDRIMSCNPAVLLVLSRNSVEDEWIRCVVSKATELGKKLKRDVLFPVTLDDTLKKENLQGWLRKGMARFTILDFSRWSKPEFFGERIQVLLNGLQLLSGRIIHKDALKTA